MSVGMIIIIIMMTIAIMKMSIELTSQWVRFNFFKLGTEGRGKL